MNRDDIIRMAMEVGGTVLAVYSPDLERFAALVAAAEREACAKVCDALVADTPDNDPDKDAIGACAAAIRARGKG